VRWAKCRRRGASGSFVVDHVSARFVAQRHPISQVPVALMVNVGRCGPDVMQSATSCAERERAARVHDTSPPVTAANEAGKPSKHARERYELRSVLLKQATQMRSA
jgi:hypothetical protein